MILTILAYILTGLALLAAIACIVAGYIVNDAKDKRV